MTKVEFIKKIVDITKETNDGGKELNQKDVNIVLSAIETVVKNAVLKDDDVTIPGVGKVKTKVVPERTGTVMMGENKGKKWTKPKHKEATFKISKSLKTIFE